MAVFLLKYVFKQNTLTYLYYLNTVNNILFTKFHFLRTISDTLTIINILFWKIGWKTLYKKLSIFLKVHSDAILWFPCVWGPQLITNNSFNIKKLVLSLHLLREWSSKFSLFPYRSCLKQCLFLKCIKNINWGRNTLQHPSP